jgi:hypothetical protein
MRNRIDWGAAMRMRARNDADRGKVPLVQPAYARAMRARSAEEWGAEMISQNREVEQESMSAKRL